MPTETATSILPHVTNAAVGRGTGPTTVLSLPAPLTTGTLAKPKRLRHTIMIVVIITAVVTALSAVLVNSYLSKKRDKAIESIAVMPFVNESGNADVEYL